MALYSGVFLGRVNPRRAAECVCSSSPVSFAGRTNETMQHLFLECPDVAAASDWLLRLWVTSLLGSATPPCSAAVLQADDDRLWQPEGSEEHHQLWNILRQCTHHDGVAMALVPGHLSAHPRGVRVPQALVRTRGSLCSFSTTNAAGQGGRLFVHLSALSPVALL